MTVTSRRTCAYCMPVDLLPVLAVDLLVQQATACGLPEVFHVSPRDRSRSIARVDLRPWCEQCASDRSEVFQLQANDVTWPGVACVCKSMKLGMHSVWTRWNKDRGSGFFAKKLTFFHRWSTSSKSKRSDFHFFMFWPGLPWSVFKELCRLFRRVHASYRHHFIILLVSSAGSAHLLPIFVRCCARVEKFLRYLRSPLWTLLVQLTSV